MVDHEYCPCGSGLTYQNCCQPFHKGKKVLHCSDLLRARYSAYALGLVEYIINTTHPASPQYCENKDLWAKRLKEFSAHANFTKLEIFDIKEEKNLAMIMFATSMTYDGEDASFVEKSYFEKINDNWFYRSGQLFEGNSPTPITTNQMRLLPLTYYGNHLLKEKAKPVAEITPDVKKLINEMIETMDACDGLGLAAPQVHHSIRIFVFHEIIEHGKDSQEIGPVKICINPKISYFSAEKWTTSEGCLSIPTIHANVERSREIEIEYLNLNGKVIKEKLLGWTARVAQHEYDHLDGVLFVDRLSEEEEKKIGSNLKNLAKRLHDGTEL